MSPNRIKTYCRLNEFVKPQCLQTMKRLTKIYAYLRIQKYRFLSKSGNVHKRLSLLQPLLFQGNGKVNIEGNVQLGVEDAPGFWSGYTYFEANGAEGVIDLKHGVVINNNAALIADNASITILEDSILGMHVSIMTSDGHRLEADRRHEADRTCLPVHIGKQVFIGDQVVVLKGVHIGDRTIIGAGSVVTKDIPDNVVAAGNPCRIIRSLS